MSLGLSLGRISVQCPRCATRARVPEAFAGRKARCKECGQGVRVPRTLAADPTLASEAGAAPLDGWEGELDVVPLEEGERPICPLCCVRMARGTAVCLRCGGGRKQPRGLRRRPRRGSARLAAPQARAKEFVLPLILFAAGAALFFAAAAGIDQSGVGNGLGFGTAILGFASTLWFWAVVSGVTCLVTGWTGFRSDYGRVDAAAVKLLAIGSLSVGCTLLAVMSLGPYAGSYAGWVTGLAVTGGLAAWLFELQVIEAVWFTVLSKFVVPKLAALALAELVVLGS